MLYRTRKILRTFRARNLLATSYTASGCYKLRANIFPWERPPPDRVLSVERGSDCPMQSAPSNGHTGLLLAHTSCSRPQKGRACGRDATTCGRMGPGHDHRNGRGPGRPGLRTINDQRPLIQSGLAAAAARLSEDSSVLANNSCAAATAATDGKLLVICGQHCACSCLHVYGAGSTVRSAM